MLLVYTNYSLKMNCLSCLYNLDDTDTINPSNVSSEIGDVRCPNCFVKCEFVDIVNVNDKCPACSEETNNLVVCKCGCWTCYKCHRDIGTNSCSICGNHIDVKSTIPYRNIKILDSPLKKYLIVVYDKAKELATNFISGCDHKNAITLLEEYEKWINMNLSGDQHDLSPGPLIDELWHYHILRTQD